MRMPLCLILLMVLGLIGPASGCLNDSDTHSSEKEFNASYRGAGHALGRVFQPIGLLLLTPPVLLISVGCWWRFKEHQQKQRAVQRSYRRDRASSTRRP